MSRGETGNRHTRQTSPRARLQKALREEQRPRPNKRKKRRSTLLGQTASDRSYALHKLNIWQSLSNLPAPPSILAQPSPPPGCHYAVQTHHGRPHGTPCNLKPPAFLPKLRPPLRHSSRNHQISPSKEILPQLPDPPHESRTLRSVLRRLETTNDGSASSQAKGRG